MRHSAARLHGDPATFRRDRQRPNITLAPEISRRTANRMR
jgi:hypothetical protein